MNKCFFLKCSFSCVFLLYIFSFLSTSVVAQSITITTSQSFTVPSGITSLTIQCWGGGGAGGRGGANNKYGGGGGAGGQYSIKTITVSSGQVYQVVIGRGGAVTASNGSPGGDTYFGSNIVLAKGGAGGFAFSGTTGIGGSGTVAGGIGNQVYAGGNGASGTMQASGGGGSGAGSRGNGNSAVGTIGGAAKKTNGGAGGNGTTTNIGSGGQGGNYGAGGGGATRTGMPGAGAPGLVIISWPCAVNLTSATGSNSQQLCVNATITPITYSFAGVSSAIVSGLPAGVSGVFNSTNSVFTISGTPTVTGVFNYTVTPTAGCLSSTATGTLTVSSSSANAGPALAAICQGGATPALSGSVNSGASGGVWSDGGVGGVFTPSSTSLNAIYTPPSQFSGVVTLTLTAIGGSCSGSSSSKLLTVNPTPVAAFSYPANAFCASVPAVNASLTGSLGGVFTSSPAGLSLNSYSGSFFPNSSLASNYQITYTVSSGGCTSSESVSVTVNALPAVNCTATGVITCQSASASLTANALATTGNTITSYQWSPSGSTAASILVTSGNTYTVTVTQSNGCTATASKSAPVDTCRPTVSTAIANSICGVVGNAIVASATPCSGAISNYLWSNGATTPTITVTEGGTFAVTVTQSGNGCTSSSTAYLASAYDVLTVNSARTAITCAGGVSTVTISASGGTPPYTGTGTYYLPAGAYNYSVTDAVGCVSSANVVVTEPSPLNVIANISSAISCFGGNGYIDVVASGGVAPYQSTGLTARPAGSYTFTVTDALGCTAASNSVSLSQPTQLAVTVTTVATNCGTSVGSATALPSGGTPSYAYDWSDGQRGANINGLAAGYYTVTVTDANGCTATTAASVGVNGGISIAATGQIIGPSGACVKSQITFSIDPVQGASGYTWTLPPNSSGTSNTNSITISFDSAYAGGTLCVTPYNICQAGVQSCISIPVILFKPAQPGPATVSGNFCGPDTLICSVAPVANTTNYIWSVSGTLAVIVGGQGTNSVLVAIPANFTSTQLGVQAFNCLGYSNVKYQMIVGRPVINTYLSGNYSICPSSTQNYFIGTVLGATSYSWSVSGDAYIQSSLNNSCTVATNAGWTGGTLTVTATNACGSGSRSFALYRSLLPPGAITGPSTNLCILAGVTTASYSISPVAGALSYAWTVPNGMTIVSNTGTSILVSIDSSYNAGSVCVAGVNACGQGSFRCMYTTAAPPIPSLITGPTNVCLSNSYAVYGVSTVTGAIDYNWYLTGGSTLTPFGSACVVNFTTATAPSSTLQVNSLNECGLSQPYRITVYIDGRCRQGQEAEGDDMLTILPNPATDHAFIKSFSGQEINVELSIAAVTGQIVLKKTFRLSAGENQTAISMDELPSGLYFVSITDENGTRKTSRLLKE